MTKLTISCHRRQLIFVADTTVEKSHHRSRKIVAAGMCLGATIKHLRSLFVRSLHNPPVTGRKYASVAV